MKPLARNAQVLVEEFDGEAVIYDQRSHRVHRLDERAHRIWRACDGRTALSQLAERTGCGSETVELTLIELQAADLLESDSVRLRSRRQLVASATALATAPLVTSVAAPTPAMAASPPPKPGTEEGGCVYKFRNGGWVCEFGSITGAGGCCKSVQIGTTDRIKCAPCGDP
jgi:hypothetical protein